MSIIFLYKNLLSNAISVTENCSSVGYGTSQIFDGDVNSPFRGTATVTGTTTILFNFGSAVYADSVAAISNIPLNGAFLIRAGTNSSVNDFVSSITLNTSGTSYKNINTQNYQYWRLDCFGATGIGKHQINEFFLGRRKVVTEMPSYPVENGIEEDNVELTSERGQRWVYNNFNREYWIFNFEGVNSTTESDLYNIYRFCGKNTTPFWMILDDTNVMDIKLCRFRDKSFLSNQVTKNVFDITMEIEREI